MCLHPNVELRALLYSPIFQSSLLCFEFAQLEMMRSWDHWVEEALQKLQHLQLVGSLRPIHLHSAPALEAQKPIEDEFNVFDELQPWDRSAVQVQITEATFQKWVHDIPSSGSVQPFLTCFRIFFFFQFWSYESRFLNFIGDDDGIQSFKKLLLFSTNDYLGLGSHPTIGKAAAKVLLMTLPTCAKIVSLIYCLLSVLKTMQ